MKEKELHKGINRRTFIQTTARAGAAAMFAGLGTSGLLGTWKPGKSGNPR